MSPLSGCLQEADTFADVHKGACSILVDMAPNVPATMSSWWEIWTAGVAVETMCVQRGMAGTAINLGIVSRDVYSIAMADS